MSEKLPMAKATLESSRPRRVLEGHDVAYAAQRLGCSTANVYRLVELGQLHYVDVGAKDARPRKTTHRIRPAIRFLDEDLDRFIASRRTVRTPEAGSPEAVAAAAAEQATGLHLVGKERYR